MKIGLDFLGNEVKTGDTIVYMSSEYRELKVGKVQKVTPKGFTVEVPTYKGSKNLYKLSRMKNQVMLVKEVV